MILVISTEDDISTDYFMEWCHYLNVDVVRLNRWEAMNITQSVTITDDGVQIVFNTGRCSFTLADISSVWFRRGYITHYSGLQFREEFKFLDVYFKNENKTLNNFISYNLKQKRSVNSQYHYNANKLITLLKAAETGLHIPDTFIGRTKEQIGATLGYEQTLITKSIQDALTIEHDGYKFFPGIHETTVDDKQLPDHFYYSKFQHRVHKKYELRIFFLGDALYAGAIFTRNRANGKGISSGTHINRVVPYLLPADIAGKLRTLNKNLGLECGSIDMIVDPDDKHYFLEVNPVGQYDYISKLCNYYLDLKMLHYLNTPNEKTLLPNRQQRPAS